MFRTVRSQVIHTVLALFLFSAVLSGVASAAFASGDLLVVYVEGVVQHVPVGSESLQIGDSVPADAVLVLDPDSFIEISTPGGRVMLSQPGRYELASLVARAGNPVTRAASSAVRSLVRNLGRDAVQVSPAVAAGVRGDGASGTEAAPVWVDGDLAAELVEEARAYLDDGLYDVALATLRDALDFGAAEHTVNYYRAAVYYRMGELREALSILADGQPDPDTPIWEPHILMQAELYYELAMYPAACELLEPLLERSDGLSDEARTSALLLLALSYTASERPQDAAYYLDRLEDELPPDNADMLELITALRAGL